MGKKILIVDDEQAILTLLSMHLINKGYETFTADSIEGARILFEEIDPALVITDIKMPVSSGLELLRVVKGASPDRPVILMSGHAELKDAIEAIRLGAFDLIVKPFDPEEVSKRVQVAIRFYELSCQKDELESILDTINDAITLHDLQYIILRANRAAHELLGKDRLVGLKCYQAFHDLNQPPNICPIHLAITERRFTKEKFFEPAVGKYLELKALPRIDKKGNVIGVVHIVRDITAEKEAEKIKTELLSNISHEFRTPLNGILGLADLMIDQNNLTFEQREYIELIRKSGNDMVRLVDRLLALSRYELGNIIPHELFFDLQMFLLKSLKPFETLAKEKGLYFTIDIKANGPYLVKTDPGKLREALCYLIDNAIKFTSEGGITVSLTTNESDGFLISVTDTGIGIPTDMQGLIFKDFIQSGSLLTKRHGGIGTGLPLAKRLIESMGGTITCSSQEGKGSTFVVQLPAVVKVQGR